MIVSEIEYHNSKAIRSHTCAFFVLSMVFERTLMHRLFARFALYIIAPHIALICVKNIDFNLVYIID